MLIHYNYFSKMNNKNLKNYGDKGMSQQITNHEILTCFKNKLIPLSNNLTEMLNEHFSHQTERRGCGFTQATRVIAEFINQEREETDFKDFRMFQDYDTRALRTITSSAKSYDLELNGWRNLHLQTNVINFLNTYQKQDFFTDALQKEFKFQQDLNNIHQCVEFEESKLLCNFLEDIILRKTQKETGLLELKNLNEKPKVGSCPMAENFFLKIAHGRLLRQGLINIFTDDNNRPILMEKLKMGDDHSCINLVPVMMNGIRIPSGSLFSVQYNEELLHKNANKHYKGYIIPISEVDGFWFLRLTTLSISPENRARAFNAHYKQQVDNGLFSPGTTLLEQLTKIAEEQI